MDDGDIFSDEHFTYDEIRKGILHLNSNKAPGFDGLTKEHLTNAGEGLIPVLHLIFSWIFDLESIPTNFRRGTQVPLYKGKNAPTLDTNSYRGITLLTTLNKLFEVILWHRMKGWWLNEAPMTRLQGACRSGISSLHTALVLQESIAALLECNRHVFVVFYDVSKAFDGVWIDELFYQMRELGISGKTWRLLYKCYVDFKCRVRVGDLISEWYPMLCGIHQGGYLSLIKYAVFINSLLVSLEKSRLCCVVHGINTTPLGYADDIAAASTSRRKIDGIMDIVYKHSTRWRYRFNAGKSAVLIYGESTNERKNNAIHRQFTLGNEKIKEKLTYDHLGVKCSITGNNDERTNDKISKGRKALGASSGIGVKKGGVSMLACNLVFWSFIIPMVTYGCELWVMTENDINLLDSFQKYAGRRLQRFPQTSPSHTSFTGLGWMRVEMFIYVRKLLFLRTITVMDDDVVYKKLLLSRARQFDSDITKYEINSSCSPIFEILRVSILFGIYRETMMMICGTHVYSKVGWKNLVWKHAWQIEEDDWRLRCSYFPSLSGIYRIMDNPQYMIWWQISDKNTSIMRECETMVRMVCKTSDLRCDDHRLKGLAFSLKSCTLCDDMAHENPEHMILQCTYLSEERRKMFSDIVNMKDGVGNKILEYSENILWSILGRPVDGIRWPDMIEFWSITAKHVYIMYRIVLKDRAGIG